MTFADWLILVERSGVPVNGVDPNWLQHQYQIQQQPALVAHMIQSGQAPRMNVQGMPSFGGKKRSGCASPLIQVLIGVLGFVGIVFGILFGIKYFADHGLGGMKQNPDPTSVISDIPPVSERVLKEKGLDTTVSYPYWPLVYDKAMVANKDTITGKVINYGDKSVSTVMIQFGLFTSSLDKIGTAQDQIASLGPGETWSYQASVKGIGYDQCRVENITFK